MFVSINPKSLFFELSLGNERWNIMVTDRTQLANWREFLAIRQWIRIDKLKKVKIHGVSTESEDIPTSLHVLFNCASYQNSIIYVSLAK